MSSPPRSDRLVNRQIISVVFFSFLAYLTVGIPLAAIPSYVQSLGYGPFLAGITISFQYIATFLTRAPAGRMCDTEGPKQTVLVGLFLCGASGLFVALAALLFKHASLSLLVLLAGRLCLGCGESFVSTGAIMWGVGRAGMQHTVRVISWNGVATYTALAIGAPLGIALEKSFGFSSIGLSILVLGWVSLPLAYSIGATIPIPGQPLSIRRIFTRVLPFGIGLALGSIGFGSIATFITLYYASHHWTNAAFCLTAFGGFFVGIRLLFGSFIDRYGGYRVAILSLFIESIGLLILWKANSMALALFGATLTGIGFSLVFPSLGVESVALVTPDNRGAALAIYSVFVDVALGITGPVGGWLASRYGFDCIFLFASGAAVTAMVLTLVVYRVPKNVFLPFWKSGSSA